jgi:hypothetical protein
MDWTDSHNETKDNKDSNENRENVDKIAQVWILAANMVSILIIIIFV